MTWGYADDPDQGDYGTLFEHLLPKPAKYPKSSTYGSVLRSAAKAGGPYQTMPDRGGTIDATTWEYRPDRDPVEYQTMPDKGITQADLNRYGENLMAAVQGGKMDVERAHTVWQAAVQAHKQGQSRPAETPQRRALADGTLVDPDGSMYRQDAQGNLALIGVNPDEYQRGTPVAATRPAPPISEQARDTDYRTPQGTGNRPVRAPAPMEHAGITIPRTANEAYQQAQQRSTADAQARQQRIAELKQRLAANRQARLDDLNRRLSAAPSSMTPTGATSIADAPPDLVEKARHYATKHGVDPERFVRQIYTESQFKPDAVNPKSGASGIAQFMPETAKGLGVDPMNVDQALDGAARYMRQSLDANGGDYRKALAAYNWGPGNAAKWDGRDESLPEETRGYLASVMGDGGGATVGQQMSQNVTMAQQQKAAKQGTSVWELGKLTPNQLTEGMAQGLDRETALAVCGPAAAIAFARKMGRNPNFGEALTLAKQVGWTVDKGMAGPASQVALLQKMGIPSALEEGPPNAAKVAQIVQSGQPVIASAPGHYFVAERYDPQTGKFDFGESARVLKAAKGNSWFTLDEINKLGMGALRATIYMAGR